MTVAELITALQECPPDAPVLIGDGDSWGEGFSGIAIVRNDKRRVVIEESRIKGR